MTGTASRQLTVAVPKGRTQKKLAELFRAAGLDDSALLVDDRRLVRDSQDGLLRFLFLKPDDVPTYVEFGAAEVGFAGTDVLLERGYDLLQPLDLGIGRCKMVVAAPVGKGPPKELPRVATKFARIAEAHFAKKGVQAEIIYVGGSVELAPVVGIADLIVDLVETGTTLRDNNLEVIEEVTQVSTVVVANRAAYKLRSAEVQSFIASLTDAVRRASTTP